MNPTHISAVVFDLGGVLAEVRSTWEDAARHANVRIRKDTGLTSQSGLLDQFQRGAISEAAYYEELGDFLECDPEDAGRVHMAALVREYPGVLEVVRTIDGRGLRTGCLSNTNAPHWEVLTRYPAIERLEMRLASHEVGTIKPDTGIFEAYTQRFDLHPEEILYFDDAPKNVVAAAALGWQARQIDPRQSTADQIQSWLGASLPAQ